jgi:hypothetical protein
VQQSENIDSSVALSLADRDEDDDPKELRDKVAKSLMQHKRAAAMKIKDRVNQ